MKSKKKMHMILLYKDWSVAWFSVFAVFLRRPKFHTKKRKPLNTQLWGGLQIFYPRFSSLQNGYWSTGRIYVAVFLDFQREENWGKYVLFQIWNGAVIQRFLEQTCIFLPLKRSNSMLNQYELKINTTCLWWMMHTLYTNTLETEAGRSLSRGHVGLQNEFQDTQGYPVKPCLKREKTQINIKDKHHLSRPKHIKLLSFPSEPTDQFKTHLQDPLAPADVSNDLFHR